MSNQVGVAFLEGQGGAPTSTGIVALYQWALSNGFQAALFGGTDLAGVEAQISAWKSQSMLTSIVAYSEGAGTGEYTTWTESLDQSIGIDPSKDCYNYAVNPTVNDSILFFNSYWLEQLTGIGGAGQNLGYKTVYPIDEEHLLADLDPYVQGLVQQHLAQLKG
jgi:hypothetical protein